MGNSDVAERFKKAVAEHQMTILGDAGVARQIKFARPESSVYHFYITTWPGHLAISGDAGSYVFARLHDMFNFFRGEDINPQYWAEKLQAVDRHSGYQEFSEEAFHEAVKSDFEQWDFESDEERSRAWDALQGSDLSEDSNPETVENAVQSAMAYICPVTKNDFGDFWDHHLTDYTFRFLWCCHAIRWAVAQYDARTTTQLLSQHNHGGSNA